MPDRPRYGTAHSCSDEQLRAFADDVRAECDTKLAHLAAVDPSTLPPDVRESYHQQKTAWEHMRALVDPEALDLQLMATLYADRELTQAEAEALFKKQ